VFRQVLKYEILCYIISAVFSVRVDTQKILSVVSVFRSFSFRWRKSQLHKDINIRNQNVIKC